MSEQRYQGTLASGGTFVADGQGLRVLDPAGNQLASFGREVISGISRDGQIVTVERHNDTVVTLTAASITDAVGLEQFVRDTFVAPVAPPAAAPEPPPAPAPPASVGTPRDEPPLAFDAIDAEAPPEAPPPPPEPPAAPRPPIISRPEGAEEGGAAARTPHDLPEPVPTTPPPPPPAAPTPTPAAEVGERVPVAPLPPSQPPPASYEPTVPPPAAPPPVTEAGEERRGRRLWLWGCLGCGGLLILAIICVAIAFATGDVDWDELTGEDETPTPHVIIVTTEPTATPNDSGESGDSSPTSDTGGGGASIEGVMSAGESGTLGGLTVTYLSSRTDDGGVVPPAEGSEFLILSFEIENTTAEPATVSTLLQFGLEDEAGNDFPVGIFADVSSSLDTEVPAGETVEGEVAFEVPQGGGSYIVTYTDFLTSEPLRWEVS